VRGQNSGFCSCMAVAAASDDAAYMKNKNKNVMLKIRNLSKYNNCTMMGENIQLWQKNGL
jgi:hypothetical protein